MANYINAEILSEAYSHLEIELFDDKEALERLKQSVSAFISERAKFLFGDEVEVVIEFEEGSLRTKVKVIGKNVVAFIVAASVTYGGFRQAMEYMAKDATLLAESANLELIFRTKAAHCDRVAIEKRRGIFGRADELLRELDLVNRLIRETELPTSARYLKEFNDHVVRLNLWQKKADKLMGKLAADSTRACIAAGFLEEIEHLAVEAPWAKKLEGQSFRVDMMRADPVHAGSVAGAAKQYQETLKYIKKYYESIVKQAAGANV